MTLAFPSNYHDKGSVAPDRSYLAREERLSIKQIVLPSFNVSIFVPAKWKKRRRGAYLHELIRQHILARSPEDPKSVL